jgi:hypothetical protein
MLQEMFIWLDFIWVENMYDVYILSQCSLRSPTDTVNLFPLVYV